MIASPLLPCEGSTINVQVNQASLLCPPPVLKELQASCECWVWEVKLDTSLQPLPGPSLLEE